MIKCESANACNNRVDSEQEPFEGSGRRLCLQCTIVSCW
jgi:hypothetical protein